ncbi:hypothetical protein FSP39_024645 [Pinctada imbricata]|uniref:G-protein coupled receptors family 1 profile domain-containing protein n=1 Tax=Pinctada imbricata TaxID=66713 RepID=A0AA89C2W4_PINIB|nr:hypothetical protein FSP39_024645 [Pinctada imbricata]
MDNFTALPQFEKSSLTSPTLTVNRTNTTEHYNPVPNGIEFFETARFINGVIVYPLVCFPGLIGNILTLIVLSRENMRTSTNAFLSALAVADTIKLINDIIYFCVMVLQRTDPSSAHVAYVHIYPYAHFVFSLSVCLSAWLTVSVAVERYILVCHPTRSREHCTRIRAIVTSSVVYVVMIGFSLPSAFRYKKIEMTDPITNTTITSITGTNLWKNTYMVHYDRFLNSLRSFIPLLILIYLNMCIINALRKTRAKKRHAQRHRVTFMMIIIIMVFLFCTTPDAVMTLFLDFGYHEEENYYAKGVREFSDSLLAVNAAVNFIIYCVLSRTFRQSFTTLFCPAKKERNIKKELPWYRRLSDQSSFWNNKKRRRSSSVSQHL